MISNGSTRLCVVVAVLALISTRAHIPNEIWYIYCGNVRYKQTAVDLLFLEWNGSVSKLGFMECEMSFKYT